MPTKKAGKSKKSEMVLVHKNDLKILLGLILYCIGGKGKDELATIYPEAELEKMKNPPKTVGEWMISGVYQIHRILDGGRISQSSIDMVMGYANAFSAKIIK
jgi:hypothetical protein